MKSCKSGPGFRIVLESMHCPLLVSKICKTAFLITISSLHIIALCLAFSYSFIYFLCMFGHLFATSFPIVICNFELARLVRSLASVSFHTFYTRINHSYAPFIKSFKTSLFHDGESSFLHFSAVYGPGIDIQAFTTHPKDVYVM